MLNTFNICCISKKGQKLPNRAAETANRIENHGQKIYQNRRDKQESIKN